VRSQCSGWEARLADGTAIRGTGQEDLATLVRALRV
jgi:hypothetical protein